ncbi:MAG: DUF3549 family protein [Pseudomonadota bacterium]|jgi:hypothetical protein|uniref:DUF3549 family protein n=1 Tax=Marisediminitalea TaxID=2662254 RepID=UPI000C3E590E|nr:DUF3549 family protein [Marisediminitalea aggregata]MBL52761.1 hypothetical protein [Alteromonadaceae bacterium]MCP3864251.1 DUF3549 family protein [Aestuariibacter sp.]MEC8228687.1 DUF3549 family protein [Pseudomonadota bacterium]MCP4234018.1 DUF3549 family protein [Aestuariibacter sp.]MCP4527049.1 DUF3549 family protein [Aestuariibacter sp.]|tara:strand:+ start:1076 stop:2119 length:1044 start_codon:yes stop_codon:yes gene_type:complete
MNSQDIHSLSEFLLHAGTDYRIFDLGRGVYPVDSQTFLEIENGKICPPRPRQQHAWYAVVFWNTSALAQRYIWFVKFPLDEQGLLIQASRNHFLQIIVDALGNQITGDGDQEKLPDNPYTFTPSQQQMAQFSAITRHTLNDAKHDGVERVMHYLKTPSVIDWQQLPVQAIADAVIELDETTADVIANQLDQYSTPFIDTLLSSLESQPLPERLIQKFCEKAVEYSTAEDTAPMHGYLRALSQTSFSPEVNRCINQVLDNIDTPDIDLLSVIAARHDAQLDLLTAQRFLEVAAKADAAGNYQHQLFIGLFSDLVQIPALRRTLLTLAKAHQHNPAMKDALAALFKQAG